jgi:hypothetical protein
MSNIAAFAGWVYRQISWLHTTHITCSHLWHITLTAITVVFHSIRQSRVTLSFFYCGNNFFSIYRKSRDVDWMKYYSTHFRGFCNSCKNLKTQYEGKGIDPFPKIIEIHCAKRPRNTDAPPSLRLMLACYAHNPISFAKIWPPSLTVLVRHILCFFPTHICSPRTTKFKFSSPHSGESLQTNFKPIKPP